MFCDWIPKIENYLLQLFVHKKNNNVGESRYFLFNEQLKFVKMFLKVSRWLLFLIENPENQTMKCEFIGIHMDIQWLNLEY